MACAQAWKAGQTQRKNGMILFVFPGSRKARLEVGYGLEGAMPDALARRVLDEQVLPRFRAGDYSGGISSGVSAAIAATKGEYKGTGQTRGQSREQSPSRSASSRTRLSVLLRDPPGAPGRPPRVFLHRARRLGLGRIRGIRRIRRIRAAVAGEAASRAAAAPSAAAARAGTGEMAKT